MDLDRTWSTSAFHFRSDLIIKPNCLALPTTSTSFSPTWVGAIRVLSRIHRLGEKSRVGESHELSGGSGGKAPPPPPGNFWKWICTEMQSGAFWDTILPYCVLRQGILTPCRVWMLFPIQLLIYCTDNNFFFLGGGGSWVFWGEASTPQIP